MGQRAAQIGLVKVKFKGRGNCEDLNWKCPQAGQLAQRTAGMADSDSDLPEGKRSRYKICSA